MLKIELTAPMVKFLKEQMEKSGCRFGDNFIRAVHCDKQIAGGYVRGEGVLLFFYLTLTLFILSNTGK